MDTLQIIEGVFKIATDIAVIAGTVVAVFQLLKMTKATKADHERKKKQSTIEFFNDMDKETSWLEALMIQKGITGHIPVDKINSDAQFKESVLRYLNLMERFSVGINTGVYDIYVFDRITGRKIIYRFNSLYAYIEQRRKELNYQYLFGDFEEMVEHLKEVRKIRFKNDARDIAKMEYDVLENAHK